MCALVSQSACSSPLKQTLEIVDTNFEIQFDKSCDSKKLSRLQSSATLNTQEQKTVCQSGFLSSPKLLSRAGVASTAGTVLAIPLFTTRLIISRRGLQHTPKQGCGTLMARIQY